MTWALARIRPFCSALALIRGVHFFFGPRITVCSGSIRRSVRFADFTTMPTRTDHGRSLVMVSGKVPLLPARLTLISLRRPLSTLVLTRCTLANCWFTEPIAIAVKCLDSSGNPRQLVEVDRSSACGMVSGRSSGSASRDLKVAVVSLSFLMPSSCPLVKPEFTRPAAGALVVGRFGPAATTCLTSVGVIHGRDKSPTRAAVARPLLFQPRGVCTSYTGDEASAGRSDAGHEELLTRFRSSFVAPGKPPEAAAR